MTNPEIQRHTCRAIVIIARQERHLIMNTAKTEFSATQAPAPQSITEIAEIVKTNLQNGTAVIGPTHYDKNGAIDLSGRKPVQLDPVDRAHVVMLAERFEEQLTALRMLLHAGYHPDSAKPLRDRMNMLGEYQPAQVYGRPDQELPAILNTLHDQYEDNKMHDDDFAIFGPAGQGWNEDDGQNTDTRFEHDDASEHEAGFGDD